ncbi:hypothetical protein FB567DRAFT_115638 [Paraphoma chrysanthemicola]|uniref:Zn(2)-C6 fungal-type domain-containing protein n=1 Tax=Paraphoma chrysanthemicola TaxID=798071 RepID=A0A8K0VWB6_9PLEO|nr:hypothetical protein FB567DRAFT_115638 [Paraphoma chrysanthemicola]
MSETTDFHPIACESCRNKKSKCDREIPRCSQCATSGSSCQYPPVNKRGIPSGYLSFIEQRLFETELVVFELLSAIYKSQRPIELQHVSHLERQVLADLSQKQSKSLKIEEWKSLPLTTDESRHEWWLRRHELIAHNGQANGTGPTQNARTPQETWLDASPSSAQYEDMPSHLRMHAQQPAPSTPQAPTFVDTWQPLPSEIVSATSASFRANDELHTNTAHPETTAKDDNGVAFTTLAEPPAQSMNAERWRKYF